MIKPYFLALAFIFFTGMVDEKDPFIKKMEVCEYSLEKMCSENGALCSWVLNATKIRNAAKSARLTSVELSETLELCQTYRDNIQKQSEKENDQAGY